MGSLPHIFLLVTQKKEIGHHARPRRASATAPLRTGADMCRSRRREQRRGTYNGTAGGAITSGRTTKQEGEGLPTRTRTEATGSAADDTPSKNAAKRATR